MNKTVSELARFPSRALSALYTKCLRAGGMTLDVFEKLYESLVEPVLFYASGIWGISDFKNFNQCRIKRADTSSVEANVLLMLPCVVIWGGTLVSLRLKPKCSDWDKIKNFTRRAFIKNYT